MRWIAMLGLFAVCACEAHGSSQAPPSARAPAGFSAAPAGAPPASASRGGAAAVATGSQAPHPAASSPPPVPEERFLPAHHFVDTTKLALYHYHAHHIGNAEGYLAPIVATADGGFLVVGTRADYAGGKFQVGKSRPVVAKLDAHGASIWERSYRTTGFLDYEGASAAELDDGYVVYVLSYVHPARGAVVRLLRLDRKGGVVWDLKLRGQGRENTPFAQNVRLRQWLLLLDGHIYKDSSDTAYGWKGSVSLDGKLLSDEVGAANPYDKE